MDDAREEGGKRVWGDSLIPFSFNIMGRGSIIFLMSVLWQRPLNDGGTCFLSNHFFMERTRFFVRLDGRLRCLSFAMALSLMIATREKRKEGHSLSYLHSISSTGFSINTLYLSLSLSITLSCASLSLYLSASSSWGDCHQVDLGRVDYIKYGKATDFQSSLTWFSWRKVEGDSDRLLKSSQLSAFTCIIMKEN